MAGNLRRLKPLLDRVLVERVVPEAKSKAGILIPEKSTGKSMEAVVVEIGPGGRDKDGKIMPITVKPGDTVLLPEYGGTKLPHQDKDYYIFRESDLLGVFETSS